MREGVVPSIIDWIIIVLSIPLIAFLVKLVRRRARELDARIERYHEEQEAAKQKGPVDPYAEYAALFQKDEEGPVPDARREGCE